MAMTSFLFVAGFYAMSGLGVYLLLNRIFSHFQGADNKMTRLLSVTVSSVLTFTGIGLATTMFLDLPM